MIQRIFSECNNTPSLEFANLKSSERMQKMPILRMFIVKKVTSAYSDSHTVAECLLHFERLNNKLNPIALMIRFH